MKPIRILKVVAVAALVLLLAGCITDGYHYRGGYGGDYYYGQPSVEYRHHGYYGPYGYGYPYYGRSGWSFGMRYGHGYGHPYYGGYYGRHGWPYYYGGGWPTYPPIIVRPRPGTEPTPGGDGGNDQGPAPWRDLERLRDGGGARPVIDAEPSMPRMQRPGLPPQVGSPRVDRPAPPPRVERPRTQAPAPAPRPRADTGGSRMERVQRAIQRDER